MHGGAGGACTAAHGHGRRRRLLRSGRGKAKRRKGEVGRAPGRSSGGGARGVGPWAGTGWPGGAAATVAADSSGERVGKGKEVAIKLTVGRFGVEDGRERVVDGEGETRSGRRRRTAFCSSISAGGGSAELGEGRRRFGRGCAAQGVMNRGGVASSGRRGGRRRLCST